MKKKFALFLALTLCLCGCSIKENKPFEGEIALPPIPTQLPAQTLPTTAQDSTDPVEETTQTVAPAEALYPWEKEFDESKYTVYKSEFSNGTSYAWFDGNENVRQTIYFNDGRIEDDYFYPNGMLSHSYFWNADGSYSEIGFLDNGYRETEADGSISMHLGTQIHSKTINADGSYQETLNSPEGLPVYEITQSADGCYNEIRYHSSGNPSKCIYSDPPAGIYYEESTYENGQMKYQISQDPHIVQETRYDEDGFMTYFHWKSADNELELFSDENGKLVKAIENGQTIEDPDTLLLLFGSYGFKK